MARTPLLRGIRSSETNVAHTDDEIDEKAAEIAVRRAREAMSDPLNTSEEQAELEVSLQR